MDVFFLSNQYIGFFFVMLPRWGKNYRHSFHKNLCLIFQGWLFAKECWIGWGKPRGLAPNAWHWRICHVNVQVNTLANIKNTSKCIPVLLKMGAIALFLACLWGEGCLSFTASSILSYQAQFMEWGSVRMDTRWSVSKRGRLLMKP